MCPENASILAYPPCNSLKSKGRLWSLACLYLGTGAPNGHFRPSRSIVAADCRGHGRRPHPRKTSAKQFLVTPNADIPVSSHPKNLVLIRPKNSNRLFSNKDRKSHCGSTCVRASSRLVRCAQITPATYISNCGAIERRRNAAVQLKHSRPSPDNDEASKV